MVFVVNVFVASALSVFCCVMLCFIVLFCYAEVCFVVAGHVMIS